MQVKLIPVLIAALPAIPAAAQSDVPDDQKFCWQENTGWLNWRDADGAAQGVRFHASYLSGFIWGENIGWINLDDANVYVGVGGCRSDWNADGSVNSADISAFLTSWLSSLNGGDLMADYSGDGSVNSADVSAFLSDWIGAVQGNC